MNIYIDGLKHQDKQFKDIKARNKEAKELRKQGWIVKCGKLDFMDLAREVIYYYEAKI